MTARKDIRPYGYIIWIAAFCLVLIGVGGCKASHKIFTIGIVGGNDEFGIMKGFKDGLAELGYIEGRNLKYIFADITNQKDTDDIKAGIMEVLAQNVDLILALGPENVKMAKETVNGTDMPVLFCGDSSPVEDGIVKSISRPGGNVTGVKTADSTAKSLEWLIEIIPGAKKIWVPYDPEDELSAAQIKKVEYAASQLDIELVLYEIHSVEEAVTGMENLPKDVDAVLRIPTSVLDRQNEDLSRIAIERKIPMGAAIQLDESTLVTFVSDFLDAGKKAARLAHQIFEGAKPVDLPVETSEIRLIINLKTAEKIGITIPDSMLLQATTIIQ